MDTRTDLYKLISFTNPMGNIFKNAFAIPWGSKIPIEKINKINNEGCNIAVHPLPFKRTNQKLDVRAGWRGGLPNNRVRDFVLDCEPEGRTPGQELNYLSQVSIFDEIAKLPSWIKQSILKIGHTGGGLQLHIRFARVLKYKEYRLLLNGLSLYTRGFSWIDVTSFNWNQCQRLIGTVNHKYNLRTYWIDESELLTLRKAFIPGTPKLWIDNLMKTGCIPTSGPTKKVKKAAKRALGFAKGVCHSVASLAVVAVEFGKRLYRLNLGGIPTYISGVYKSILLQGETKFSRNELKQFGKYRFYQALKEVVVQSMTIRQLKSLTQISPIIKTCLNSKDITIYNNNNEVGIRKKNILVGYRITMVISGAINSLERKKKAHKSQNGSFDIVDLAMSGLILSGVISRLETYESAWKRTVLYLSEIIGLVEPIDKKSTENNGEKEKSEPYRGEKKGKITCILEKEGDHETTVIYLPNKGKHKKTIDRIKRIFNDLGKLII